LRLIRRTPANLALTASIKFPPHDVKKIRKKFRGGVRCSLRSACTGRIAPQASTTIHPPTLKPFAQAAPTAESTAAQQSGLTGYGREPRPSSLYAVSAALSPFANAVVKITLIHLSAGSPLHRPLQNNLTKSANMVADFQPTVTIA